MGRAHHIPQPLKRIDVPSIKLILDAHGAQRLASSKFKAIHVIELETLPKKIETG